MKYFGNSQTLSTRLYRIGFNIFPAYRRTGGRVKYISGDWKKVIVTLKLNLGTRNYVGTVFGGSIYGAVDPIYMIQLLKILGGNYVVWDKSAEIKFLRPIKTKVNAVFLLTNENIEQIKKDVLEKNEMNFDIDVQFKDRNNIIYAIIKKRLYISDKEYYKNKLRLKQIDIVK